ncbi:MAG: GMC family oxidoreductase [Phycisphaeraceae bacterium]|nr:GMC family oxidoreductase [Phycisphaeraceae bacterium]
MGVHLAAQIARRGRSVLLLESGGRTLDSFPSATFEVIGRKHDGIGIGRSVSLGGTSNLWGGQLVEFMPSDLDGRDWLAGSRWPLRYDELAAYYRPTYEALGVGPEFQDDGAVWKSIHKPTPQFGHGVEVFLTRWLKTPNIAAHYAGDVESNPNLRVVLGGTVVGLEATGQRVTAVHFVDARGHRRRVQGKDVVLAAGTIENARLLLHAAADTAADCPWRGNDNIGRWFHDHLGGSIARIRPRNVKAFYDAFCTVVYRGQKFQPKVRLLEEIVHREPLLNCQAMIAYESSVRENLVFLKQFVKAAIHGRRVGSPVEFIRNVWACSRHMIPLMWKFVIEHRVLIPSGSRISLFLQAEIEPLRESRVRIDPTVRDRFGLPKVLLDWRLSGRELESVQAFVRRVEGAFAEAGLADLEIEPALAAGDPAFLDTLHDTNHQAGGCVMGDSAENGVVDRDLKVFGTDNLYVSGAAVFRTGSNANCTFTAMTLATRLADHLAGGQDHAAD